MAARGVCAMKRTRGLFQLLDCVFVLQELIGGEHGDAIPGADLVAEGAADAAGEVDGADLEGDLVSGAGDDADAIDGADDEAGFAAGAHVFVEKGQRLGEFLLGHESGNSRGRCALSQAGERGTGAHGCVTV